MGEWAKSLFGRGKFDCVGIVLAGTIKPKFEKKVLSLFDQVVSSKDAVYHAHLVRKGKKFYPIMTNVYGGPAMMDALAEMYDGGCRTVVFVGYAYGGFQNLAVGSAVVSTKAYHFDGIYSPFDPSRTVATPNRELRVKVKEILDKAKISYTEGSDISVPAVTFQLPHANERYQKIKPSTVEMELASCFSRGRDIGMRTAGILIISDNRTSSIGDVLKPKITTKAKFEIIKLLSENLTRLDFPPLKTKRQFCVNEYLANIIEDQEDVTNVYRKKK
ncbi:MAG: hypothetical protein KAT43_04040 [Nanoarchaeota archaeon]|nr:hypothetical protein [Nanoarchaeota archaeon]